MTKDNYINLFNYCSRHLINKENTENIHMFNKITKNLEKKIIPLELHIEKKHIKKCLL